MQISFEGTSLVTTSSLPEGLLAQLSPMISTGQYPGTCNPAAYLSTQQVAETQPMGVAGILDGINGWVNNNILLAAGVVAAAFVMTGGKLTGKGK